MLQFVNPDPVDIEKKLIETYETITERTLYPADPERLLINVITYVSALLRHDINWSANQNLLAFATGEYLEKLGEFLGVYRLPPSKARTVLRFSVEEPLNFDIHIPQGTKVSPDSNLYFYTLYEGVIKAGDTFVDVEAECEEPGEIGNGFTPGQINQLFQPIPYVSVENITTSMYGAEEESDEHLRERIRLAPESFSNAGSKGAYVFHTKSVHQDIEDVSVLGPESGFVTPGQVLIVFILSGGRLPEEEMLSKVREHLSDRKVRPLTDQVFVETPEIVQYSLDVEYWILKEQEALVSEIQKRVNKAIEDYVLWQKSKIGRDILLEELLLRLKEIKGVYRVKINSPVYTKLNEKQIAVCTDINVRYQGLMDV